MRRCTGIVRWHILIRSESYNAPMTSTLPQPTHWHSAQLFVDSEGYFDRLLECIDAAKVSVDFEFYIFEMDALGRRFVHALCAAAERGVRVRVLMDGVGSMEDGELISEMLSAHRVDVRIYHPLPWSFDTYRWSRWPMPKRPFAWFAKFVRLLWKMNRRDHRKLCVVDGEIAWVGSFNITADHLPERAGGRGWRDYAVELTGPRVKTLVEGFDDLWIGHSGRLRRGFLAGYLSNRSVKSRQLKNRYVARTVVTSRRRVWLVMAYFLPTAGLRRALLQACRNGSDVCLLLPERSDVWIFPGLSSHYYRRLLEAGARIFLYQPGVLHAKALMVDDMAILGSSNWNYRSSLHDLELDVVLRDKEFLADLQWAVERDMAVSRELKLADIRRPGLLSRMLYGLRYWM